MINTNCNEYLKIKRINIINESICKKNYDGCQGNDE